ncbi:MAG: DUF1835 domain-containing protein [Ktedonobacteraceae bacterium]|nr:DUF1835 domain-containing protein [Ktedonobacteraceae bacterium]
MLHITNGESTGNGIQQTGIAGEVLTWDDVLHEGPTPADLSLEGMSQVRARFVADYYRLPYEEVVNGFQRRDTALTRFRNHDEVVLWFEHDLYDQLQLIQILDWFARQERGGTRLSLICIDTFPGIDHFLGLGQLTPAQLASLFDTRQEITHAMVQLGREAWSAYCSPMPLAVEALRGTHTAALPFLEHALLRHLEEFPAIANGLARTEQYTLEIVASGVQKPAEIFQAMLSKEESAFMGDTTFWNHLALLCQGSRPLLKRIDSDPFVLPEKEAFLEQRLVPTENGYAVLAGQADQIMLKGGIDRWLGGVHLLGQDATWRWDGQRNILIQKNEGNLLVH